MKIAIQRDSLYCFHAHVYYNLHWFISTRPLHYFLVPFPYGIQQFKLPYLLHIQVYGFLPFPYPSNVQSPLSVWSVFNITAFVLSL
jgi:hypothetical protein